ncbi:MAG: sulfotransferase domain-containing protein, partial [Pseudomonadota bacterium]
AKVPGKLAQETDLFALKRLAFHFRQDGDVLDNLHAHAGFQAAVDRVKMIYDEAAYLDHFARLCVPETKTVCDITPAYSAIGREGFEYMKAYFSSQDVRLKLFFVMRDPVDRLWSHLRYRDRHDAERDVRHTWPERIKDSEMLAFSDYRATVEALEAVFPPEDLLFLFYEELFSGPAFKELSAFAGVTYTRPDSAQSVNETPLKLDLPDEAREALRGLLEPQYAFCRKRFAGAVPAAWMA